MIRAVRNPATACAGVSGPKVWRQALVPLLSVMDVPQLAVYYLLAFGEKAHVHASVGAGAVDVAVKVDDDVRSLVLEEVGHGAGAVAFEKPLPLAEGGRRKFSERTERGGGGERHEQRTLR